MNKFLLQQSVKVQFYRRLDDSADLSNLQNNRSVKQKTNNVVGVAVAVVVIIIIKPISIVPWCPRIQIQRC